MSRKIKCMVLAIAVLSFSAAARSSAANSVALEVGADTPVIEAGKTQKVTVRALVRPHVGRSSRPPLAVALV
ncbi:MAG: hypothetical protein LBQ36_04470, partial [Synergistaceae bacterium]|nr:hypothetical protein [Synergistaceae bacterium]